MKTIIKDSYTSLKNRLGRVPYLMDFYENGEIDPLVIIREYKTYQDFLVSVEKECYREKITDQEKLTLEYLSKTVLSGVSEDFPLFSYVAYSSFPEKMNYSTLWIRRIKSAVPSDIIRAATTFVDVKIEGMRALQVQWTCV